MSVSIVILCVNETQCILKNLLDSVVDQTVKPAEIILIDASKNKLFKDLFYSYETSIHKLYHSEPGSYPGNSRNIGVSLASSELIGFLDIKTIPSKDWLNSYIGYIEDANCDLIFGETYFHASSFFEKIYLAGTYGNICHETVPGSLFKKSIFNESKKFNAVVRSAEDIEWKKTMLGNVKTIKSNDSFISYFGLPANLREVFFKYLNYSFYGSLLDVQQNIKMAYLSTFCVLAIMVLPRWNYLLESWDESPFFISDITKKVYLTAIVVGFSYILLASVFKKFITSDIFLRSLKLIFLIITFSVIYGWNEFIGSKTLYASLYFPHVTKISVSLAAITLFIYRGVCRPYKRGVTLDFLFPINWILVGGLGVFIDLIKFPIYIFGAVYNVIFSTRN